MRQFKADLEQVLEKAHAAGVVHIVTVGSTLAERGSTLTTLPMWTTSP
jgi:Tat protein secretion system quality control protein TatD with DNase activity